MTVHQSNKILFLAPYPFGRVGSQRFRFEQYWDDIKACHEIRFQSFLSNAEFDILYTKGNVFRKIAGVLKGFLRRIFILFTLHKYDVVFIHREASPIGPPIFEWIIARLFNKRIIYDFDDAIWLDNTSAENGLVTKLKCHWKVASICKWAWKVSCGNDFLCEYAKQYNSQVLYIPTTLDVDKLGLSKTQDTNTKTLTVGWTGTHSTLKYINIVLPVLQELQERILFNFVLIADKDPKLQLKNYHFVTWNKETEWADLAKIDIGIMPLEQSEWEEGKCGFKALQYMAMNIPALASPTAANLKIMSYGKSEFVCHTIEDWRTNLEKLLNDSSLRKKMGEDGRKNVEQYFSKAAWSKTYLTLLDNSNP